MAQPHFHNEIPITKTIVVNKGNLRRKNIKRTVHNMFSQICTTPFNVKVKMGNDFKVSPNSFVCFVNIKHEFK